MKEAVAKLDIKGEIVDESNPDFDEICGAYGVMAVPTLIISNDGKLNYYTDPSELFNLK